MSQLTIALATAFLITGAVQANDYEPLTTTVPVSDVLNQDVVKGDLYSIADSVTVDGYMNHFQIDSEFGPFSEVGNQALKRLLHEIEAIAELKKMSSVSVGANAAVDAVTDTGKSVVNIVVSPVDTAKGLTGGVSRFFKRSSKTAKDVSHHDADDAEDSDLTSKAVSSFMGIGKAQRHLAQELKVDPYSDNAVLQEEMKRVANIAGSVGKLTKMALPIPSVISTAASVSKMVWNLSPTDLLIQNQETLKKLGYKNELIGTFFANKMYSPTMQTAIVTALSSLKDAKNTAVWLDIADDAQTTIESRFLVRTIVLAQQYHEKVASISKFISTPHTRIPVALTSEENGLIVAAVDLLSWTEGADQILEKFGTAIRQHHAKGKMLIWVEGKTSDMASTQLKSRGWEALTIPMSQLETEKE